MPEEGCAVGKYLDVDGHIPEGETRMAESLTAGTHDWSIVVEERVVVERCEFLASTNEFGGALGEARKFGRWVFVERIGEDAEEFVVAWQLVAHLSSWFMNARSSGCRRRR